MRSSDSRTLMEDLRRWFGGRSSIHIRRVSGWRWFHCLRYRLRSPWSVSERLGLLRILEHAVHAGVPMGMVLRVLARVPSWGKRIRPVVWIVEEGNPLWVAFQWIGFPAHETALIRVGEQTGTLTRLIPEVCRHIELVRDLNDRLRQVIRIHGVTLMAAAVAAWIIGDVLLPSVIRMVEAMGSHVPLWTLALVRLGQGLLPGLVGLGAVGWVLIHLGSDRVRVFLQALEERAPVWGRLRMHVDWAHAYQTVAVSETAGWSSVRAWKAAAEACQTEQVRRACRGIAQYLEEAPVHLDIGTWLHRLRVPPMDALFLQAGMEMGEWTSVCGQLSRDHMRQALLQAQTLQHRVSVGILLLLGLLVAAIVLGGYMPLFQLYGK